MAAWLDGYYHVRVHGGTGETPKARLGKSKREPRRIPVTELVDIFLWEEERRVDKTGCVKVAGNLYEVDLALVGKTVSLRFDPFDLSLIQVWHSNQRYDNALPLELNRPRHRRVNAKEAEKKAPVTDEVSFFEAAEKKRQQELVKEPLSFAGKGEQKS
ncbi:MAG: Mu transposase C-terminal domain-containing protein [Bacillota bacterium]